MNVFSQTRGGIARIITVFERVIVAALVVLMMIVVALAALDLAWILTKDIITAPVLLLDVNELLEIFGFFLLILIGIELLETMKAYLRNRTIDVSIVLEVALIAIARKVIVLGDRSGEWVLAISALIFALAVSMLVMTRSRPRPLTPKSTDEGPARA